MNRTIYHLFGIVILSGLLLATTGCEDLTRLMGLAEKPGLGMTRQKPVQIRKKIEDPLRNIPSVSKKEAVGDTNHLGEEETSTTPPEYSAIGKIDPFKPFIKKKEPPKKKKPKRKKRKPRGPLEKIDLSQLMLTGVIKTNRGNVAMVEETSGKGYTIGTGTYIGTNAGRVIKILKDRIIVEEEIEAVDGEFEMKKRELKLQRFSGEGNYE